MEDEGAEAVMPGLTDFLLYCAYNQNYKYRYLSGRKSAQVLGNIAIRIIEYFRRTYREVLSASKRFYEPETIKALQEERKQYWILDTRPGKAGS